MIFNDPSPKVTETILENRMLKTVSEFWIRFFSLLVKGMRLFMNINETVAQNVKQMREQKNLTLDAASAITGVSRSMLAQIEKGDVNPTISVLWKIAEGYKVPFTSLIDRTSSQVTLIRAENTISVSGYDESFINYLIFPFDKDKRFETHHITIMPGGSQHSTPHMAGTEEFITVFSGKLEITVGKEVFILKAGDSIHFIADVEHSYRNIGKTKVAYHDVIFYK